MRKQLIITLLLLLSASDFLSQEEKKTTVFISMEFSLPSENYTKVKDNNLRFTFGVGLGFNLKTQITESLALVYGLEYAFTRRKFVVDEFDYLGSFSQLRYPIYLQYSLAFDYRRKNSIDLFMGVKVIAMKGGLIAAGISGNSVKKYEMRKVGGAFPLLAFGVGYNLRFKRKYFIGLEAGYNLGFWKATTSIFRKNHQVLRYDSNLTHLHFKVLFPLNVN